MFWKDLNSEVRLSAGSADGPTAQLEVREPNPDASSQTLTRL